MTLPPTETPSATTIVDVAKLAEVSIASVSRVMNGRKVGADIKARVEAAMERLQYQPNMAAQSMRAKQSRTIVCAIRGALMPELSPFIKAADEVFRAAGYSLLITVLYETLEGQRDTLHALAGRGMDGLLVTPTAQSDAIFDSAIAAIGAPVVVLDRDARPPAHIVDIDHSGGVRQAVAHLAAQGHRRIAMLSISNLIRPGRERLLGYKTALKAHGIELDPRLVSDTSLSSDQSSSECFRLLRSDARPSAIIAGGMNLLPDVIRCAQTLGLEVGRDLAVIAGCDSELAELKTPGITAIRWDLAAWGRTAAQTLLQAIQNPQAHTRTHITLPTELVVRASSQSCRT